MDFYYMLLSAPCRGPMLTAEACGIKLNLKPLDLMKGEQMAPEFLAINPHHCVPTLVDGDFNLWESRAISAYFANKSGIDSLYPRDARKRALVDRLLYFDMGSVYGSYMKWAYPTAFENKAPEAKKLEELHTALGHLEAYIGNNKYTTGDSITIADHALAASVETFKATGVDFSKYPKMVSWLKRCQENMPGYDKNLEGATHFGGFIKGALAKF